MLLSGCSLLSPKDKEAEAMGIDTSGPPAFTLEVDAPKQVRALLEQHLELKRFRHQPDLQRRELSRLLGAADANIRNLIGELQELCLMIVGWIMRLAPLGLAALLLQLVATQNSALLGSLGHFIAVVVGSTLFHGAIVLPAILWLVTGVSPLRFFKGAREALLTAFVTSSSAATLPITLRCTEQHLHVKKDIASFVVPLGATMNMDGTALYEAAAALFVARLAGIELDFANQAIVFFVAMLGAIGAPGIPSVGMLSMVLVLESVGLPTEAIAILLPIDRLLDTVRTAVNVEGDMVGSLVVQKLAGDTAKT